MIRILSAAALIAASLTAAPAFAAHHSDYEAQSSGSPYYSHDQYQNGYNENPAFTQGCPRGSIPESFPNGSGRRCALPNGGYTY